MLQRHVLLLLHGVVEAVLLLPCTRHEVYCKPFIGPSTRRAQASLHCWPASWLGCCKRRFHRPRPITFLIIQGRLRAHSRTRHTHCFCSFANSQLATTTHAPQTIHRAIHRRRRSARASTAELRPIDHWCSIGRVRHARKPNSLSALGHSYFSCTVVAPFGARLRQTRRDF